MKTLTLLKQKILIQHLIDLFLKKVLIYDLLISSTDLKLASNVNSSLLLIYIPDLSFLLQIICELKNILKIQFNLKKYSKSLLKSNYSSCLVQRYSSLFLFNFFLKYILLHIKKDLFSKYNINTIIKIKYINNIFYNIMLVGKYIKYLIYCQLVQSSNKKKKINLLQILSNIFKISNIKQIKMLQIELSGIFERGARTETVKNIIGSVPKGYKNENLQYITYPLRTKLGIIGIKIWLIY